MITGNKLIQIRELTIGHGRPLYSGISFDISEGDCIMLCGANGSGKTTLLNAIYSMQAGRWQNSRLLDWKKQDREQKNRKKQEESRQDGIKKNGSQAETAMIPSRIPKVKGFTLEEFIRASCFRQTGRGGRLSPEDEAEMGKSMHSLGIEGLAGRDISSLSDGEFQKAGIAAALTRRASVILLDEPTAFLDAENRRTVLKSLKDLCADGRGHAVIFSTHDLHDGLAVCNKVLALGADGVFRCASDNQESDSETRSGMSAAVAGIFRERL